MKKNTNFNDDLIGSNKEPIIIHQSGGSDRKFIYTILILLVVLFIIALAVIFYLGTKFFNNTPNEVAKTEQKVVQVAKKPTPQENSSIQSSIVAKHSNVVKRSSNSKSNQQSSNSSDVSELENILNEEKSKTKKVKNESQANNKITKAVSNATAGVKLSQDDLKKIAQMVAQQLAKSSQATRQAKNKNSNSSSQKAPVNEEEALVQSLQAASTDTLKEEKVNVKNIKNNGRKVANKSNKKVDTFNKVIVKENSNNNDEFAKLSKEIDTILNTDEVRKNTKKEEKTLSSVVNERQQSLRFIVVKPGDTLSSIARRAYGKASAYIKIYKANPDLVKNPNKIYVGMKLRVPLDEKYEGNE